MIPTVDVTQYQVERVKVVLLVLESVLYVLSRTFVLPKLLGCHARFEDGADQAMDVLLIDLALFRVVVCDGKSFGADRVQKRVGCPTLFDCVDFPRQVLNVPDTGVQT